jgi:uncharacterized protein (DUF736 family)
MATIGIFTKNGDGYVGRLTTLTLSASLAFEPVTSKKGEKSPDYRILSGESDFGAAWKKTSREGAEYLSVSFDDPAFPAPIQCSLIKSGIEHGYRLVWERPRARD